jgi:hypothetical protein
MELWKLLQVVTVEPGTPSTIAKGTPVTYAGGGGGGTYKLVLGTGSAPGGNGGPGNATTEVLGRWYLNTGGGGGGGTSSGAPMLGGGGGRHRNHSLL